MKSISNKALFGLAVSLGMALVLCAAAYDRWAHPPEATARAHYLSENVWVAEQLDPATVPDLAKRVFVTIVDLRPDGEVAGQPSAKEMESVVTANHMHFAYVPVLHGDIPDSAVAALSQAISARPGRVLLYCRSGRRAARTWALVEASRPEGLDAVAIEDAVKQSGQSADDLDAAIKLRIAKRSKTPGAAS